jgi:class 3 adenylate cyclase/pSer/pThr/pTyr-binding forkhead associated (FHA) protein
MLPGCGFRSLRYNFHMSDPGVNKTEELLRERLRLDAELEKRRRLLTVLFLDIAGSTRFYEQRGDVAGVLMVEGVVTLFRPLIEKQGGVFIKTMGDAIMTRFGEAPAAVRCAVEMQRELASRNAALVASDQVRIRIAVNSGYGLVRDNDVFGDFVNVAARIETAAEPGEILISPSTYEQIQKLPEFRIVQKARGVMLKGKSVALDLYSVLWRDEKLPEAAPPAPSREQLVMATGLHLKLPGIDALPPAGGQRPPAPARFCLARVLPDGREIERHQLGCSPAVAGRRTGDIRLPDDPLLAARHASFTAADDGCWIEDLTEAYGAFVRLRAPHELADGDVLLIGQQKLRFVGPEKPGAPAEPASPTGTRILGGVPDHPVSGAYLEKIDGGAQQGERYMLGPQDTVLGRTQGAHQFADDYMSGQHARITASGGKFLLEDLNSTNGTFVYAGRRAFIRAGDTVLLGAQLLKLIDLLAEPAP